MPLVLGPKIKETTEIVGTSVPIRLKGRAAGLFPYSTWLASGDETICYLSDGNDPPNLDVWKGIYTPGTGPSGEDEITRAELISSTTPGGVNWGAGVKDAFCEVVPGVVMEAANKLQEIADLGGAAQTTARGNLALGTISTAAAGDYHALGNPVLLPADPVEALQAATKQFAEAQGGGLALAAGDQILWAGDGAIPTGYTLQSITNRLVMIVNSAGLTKGTGGDWDNSTGLNISNHTLSVNEIPTHEHDVDVTVNNVIPGADGANVPAHLVNAGGGASRVFTSTSKGGGAGHDHNITSGDSWRPRHQDLAIIQKNA